MFIRKLLTLYAFLSLFALAIFAGFGQVQVHAAVVPMHMRHTGTNPITLDSGSRVTNPDPNPDPSGLRPSGTSNQASSTLSGRDLGRDVPTRDNVKLMVESLGVERAAAYFKIDVPTLEQYCHDMGIGIPGGA
ncbi:hypothetical protein D9758_012244 [Tetrapyrgos nigripes]|uniref:Uncharacterized protein n=1 Tax=Tetrapyrgos nigripes TaxID=182062 RepID=A0A8H5CAW4_9AGAR|nr:hypothetical protein D9758_012244 [Tetrapyrgos nigripes]